LIVDPWFYAAAVPAVLLMGLSKSGFASGLGAFATPLMALSIPVPQAAAIMLPLLLVMDSVGVQQLWHERDPAMVRFLVPAGLLGVLVGALSFRLLPGHAVAAVVGGITLAFVAQRLWMQRHRPTHVASRRVGFSLGIASGFTSFVAHAGGPPIAAYLLPMRLDPIRYTATSAIFFGAVNLSKWIPYACLGLIDRANLTTSAVLLPLAPIGVWLGIRMARVISPVWFYRFAYVGMVLTGVKLLYDGLIGHH
jgi:uncharacterized membrane protein YfcA